MGPSQGVLMSHVDFKHYLYVALLKLRNCHVPCNYFYISHVACHLGLKYQMSPCRFEGFRASLVTELSVTSDAHTLVNQHSDDSS